MKHLNISFRYAKAFFLLTQEQTLESVNQELKTLSSLISENRNFLDYLKETQIGIEKKRALLEKITSEKILIECVLYLISKGRIQFLPDISSDFNKLLLEKLHAQEATIITALPLNSQVLMEIQKTLENKFQKTIFIQQIVDKSLISGMILFVGDQFVDYSMKGRLDKLKKTLLNEVHHAA